MQCRTHWPALRDMRSWRIFYTRHKAAPTPLEFPSVGVHILRLMVVLAVVTSSNSTNFHWKGWCDGRCCTFYLAFRVRPSLHFDLRCGEFDYYFHLNLSRRIVRNRPNFLLVAFLSRPCKSAKCPSKVFSPFFNRCNVKDVGSDFNNRNLPLGQLNITDKASWYAGFGNGKNAQHTHTHKNTHAQINNLQVPMMKKTKHRAAHLSTDSTLLWNMHTEHSFLPVGIEYLYGISFFFFETGELLTFSAAALSFSQPSSGERVEYRVIHNDGGANDRRRPDRNTIHRVLSTLGSYSFRSAAGKDVRCGTQNGPAFLAVPQLAIWNPVLKSDAYAKSALVGESR